MRSVVRWIVLVGVALVFWVAMVLLVARSIRHAPIDQAAPTRGPSI